MAEKRKFRFGAQVSKAASASAWVEKARKIADLGYSSLLMPDHFHDMFGPLVALTAAALAAPTLRIGTLVLDNDFRHPADLAKELATLDLVTGGRLELGIGAGWMLKDYQQSGIPYDPPQVRIDRFEEALAIIRGLFRDGAFSFSGKHYTVTDLDGQPKPVQKPHPPLMIGAGRKRLLSIAAREADIVNVTFSMRSGIWDAAASATGTAEATAQKMQWLREAAGARLNQLELSVPVFVAEVTDRQRDAAARIAPQYGLTPEQALGSPHFLIGSLDWMVEEIERRRADYGFSYLIFGRETHEALAPVVARLTGT
jgi:probable F420-dependent oxidoreductase